MTPRDIFLAALVNIFDAIRGWLDAKGCPFSPEQEAAIADVLAGQDWSSAEVERLKTEAGAA